MHVRVWVCMIIIAPKLKPLAPFEKYGECGGSAAFIWTLALLVWVCVFVCLCVCARVWMRVYSEYLCVRVCACVCVCACMCVWWVCTYNYHRRSLLGIGSSGEYVCVRVCMCSYVVIRGESCANVHVHTYYAARVPNREWRSSALFPISRLCPIKWSLFARVSNQKNKKQTHAAIRQNIPKQIRNSFHVCQKKKHISDQTKWYKNKWEKKSFWEWMVEKERRSYLMLFFCSSRLLLTIH